MSRNRFLRRNKRIRLKDKRVIQRVVFTVTVFFLLVALVAWGAHNQRIRITSVYVEGNSAISDKEIKELVKREISEKYLWLFPKDNIFIYPRWYIKEKILSNLKRSYYAKVNTNDLTSIIVTIKERDPYALWCGENTSDGEPATSDTCFFMDNTGFVFARAPNFSDDVYFTVFGALQIVSSDSNTFDSTTGKRFLGEEYFTRLMLFRDTLLKEGIDVAYLVLQDNVDIELHITTGGKLIFTKKQNIEKVFHDLISAIKARQADEMKVWDGLEYIDLRFDNKVLFKFF